MAGHNCGMQPSRVMPTPQAFVTPTPIITQKAPQSSIQNPFLPFLKTVNLPEPNPYEPQLYGN